MTGYTPYGTTYFRNAVAFIPKTTTDMKWSDDEALRFDAWLAAHDAKVRAEQQFRNGT